MKRWLPPLRTGAFIILVLTFHPFSPVHAQLDDDGDADAETESPRAPHELAGGPKPLPIKLHGHRMHLHGDKLIVFGGFSRGQKSKATWIYDFQTEEWNRGADLHRARAFFSSVRIDDELYAVGDSIEMYDVEEGGWEAIYSGNEFPVSHFGAAAVGQTIYTIGGFPSERGRVAGFDVETRTVIEVPGLPGLSPGDHFHFVVELGGELHVLGGLGGSNMHQVFDGAEWREAAAIPEPAFAKFAVYEVADDRLYMFWEDEGYCYELASDSWSPVQPLGELLGLSASFVRDGRIYVLGGIPARDAPVVRVYNIQEDDWQVLDPHEDEPWTCVEGSIDDHSEMPVH